MLGKIHRNTFPYLYESSWVFSVKWQLNF